MEDDRYSLFAQVLQQSLADANKISDDYISYDKMRRKLNTTKKTVSNWVNGDNIPRADVFLIDWFNALGVSALPYILKIIHPAEFSFDKPNDDKAITEQLIAFIQHDCPPHVKRVMAFWLFGNHGSDPYVYADKIAADLNSPLRDRVASVNLTITNYQLAESTGTLPHPDNEQPHMENLKRAATSGYLAAAEQRSTYVGKK